MELAGQGADEADTTSRIARLAEGRSPRPASEAARKRAAVETDRPPGGGRCGAPPGATRSAPTTPTTPPAGAGDPPRQGAHRGPARADPLDADRRQARGAGGAARAASGSSAARQRAADARTSEDWVALIPAEADGPAERAERHEAIARSREALQTLKPQELRALTLLAEGYSYAEIGEITGFSQTKINRCLAEGRERFRSLLSRSEDGRRCAELRPLLSAFCDGEASARRPRRCASTCAPARTAARPCAPTGRRRAPRRRWRRCCRSPARCSSASTRRSRASHRGFGGGGGAADSALSQVAAAGGDRGAGMAALAKVLAICVGSAGGAAACVATGVVPAPAGASATATAKAATRRAADRPGRRGRVERRQRGGLRSGAANRPRRRNPAPPAHHDPRPRNRVRGPPRRRRAGRVEYAPEPLGAAAGAGRRQRRSSAGASGERQRRRGVRAVKRRPPDRALRPWPPASADSLIAADVAAADPPLNRARSICASTAARRLARRQRLPARLGCRRGGEGFTAVAASASATGTREKWSTPEMRFPVGDEPSEIRPHPTETAVGTGRHRYTTADVWLEGQKGERVAPESATLLLRRRPARLRPAVGPRRMDRREARPAVVRIEHPRGPLPISGIRGYAVSVDLGAGSLPAPGRSMLRRGRDRPARRHRRRHGLRSDRCRRGRAVVRAVAVSGSGMRSARWGARRSGSTRPRPEVDPRGSARRLVERIRCG